ncbi:Signal transduction histidine kinase [Variovorax sp. CF079]|uniref:ATP-binding protein n=1 Tax=Variovorax sp. CF079 TaxID=1882774 RepID=UPI00088EEDE1|nr:ATP-binding protein [Variovorax sp. CF079]SDC62360.1 Signal transduction histidine kinase [Variovorax sp. CF079]
MNMTGAARRWSGPPLALQMMGLLLGGLVVAQLVTLGLTMLLPPEPQRQWELEDIARVLAGAGAEIRGSRSLQRELQAGPPEPSGPGWLTSERSRRELAQLLGRNETEVRLYFYTPLPFAGTTRASPRADLRGGFVLADFQVAQAGRGPGGPGGPGGGGFGPGFPGMPPGGGPFGGPFGGPAGGGGAPMPAPAAPSRAPGDASPPAAPAEMARGGPTPAAPAAGPPADAPSAGRAPDAPAAGPQPQGATAPGPGPATGGAAPSAGAPPPLPPGGTRAAAAPLGEPSPMPFLPSPAPSGLDGVSPRTPAVLPPTAAPAPVPSRKARPLPADTPQPAAAEPAALVPPAASVPSVPAAPSALQRVPAARPAERPVPEEKSVSVNPPARGLFGLAPAPFVEGDFIAAMRVGDGNWATVQPVPEPFPNAWQRRVLLWFLIAAAVVAPAGWMFSRRLVRPIAGFAHAAERLGRDPAAPVLALEGPAELGRAAQAFNLMQSRLRSFVDDRTAMIGAISHDLRTPLTRMRFRIEDVPDDMRTGMLQDMEEMERMISSVLAFIRDASEPGSRERLDLSSLLKDVVDDAAFVGKDVRLERSEQAAVEVDAIGVRRLLDNLIENAVKYGEQARVRLFIDEDNAVAEVSDSGPGLPDDELQRVFQPFYRAPAARASGKQGSGLGLAVCRSIARAHGGEVQLKRGPRGLVAQLRLPLAYREALV